MRYVKEKMRFIMNKSIVIKFPFKTNKLNEWTANSDYSFAYLISSFPLTVRCETFGYKLRKVIPLSLLKAQRQLDANTVQQYHP